MDELVRAALRKWPDVPHCYGWLALDARGQWYMRDERVQAAGPFPQVKGSRITHDKLLGFIHRNYTRDERGAAYFQNGPQRVYVDLEAAPYVWRLQEQATGAGASVQVSAHTGEPAQLKSCWLDDEGRLFLECDIGLGLVHSLDMAVAVEAVEAGTWVPEEVPFAQMPARFGYVLTPRR
ncbi:MAG: hypothetical protein RI988_513 [Pseudomonadota bacterium]|jgi:hypothetical protein